MSPCAERRSVYLDEYILTVIEVGILTGENASRRRTDLRVARVGADYWNAFMINACEPIVASDLLTSAGSFVHGNSTSITGLAFEGVVFP